MKAPSRGPVWSRSPERFAGEIGAVLALDSAQWRKRGARFTGIDDGDGERVLLAEAALSTTLGTIHFGVLDYGEASTYLLIDADKESRPKAIEALLEELCDLKLIAPAQVLNQQRGGPDKGRPEAPHGWQRDTRSASEEPSTQRRRKTGTVRWFNDEKGYGFIAPDDGGKDIFVERRAILGEGFEALPKGTKVDYDSDPAPLGEGPGPTHN